MSESFHTRVDPAPDAVVDLKGLDWVDPADRFGIGDDLDVELAELIALTQVQRAELDVAADPTAAPLGGWSDTAIVAEAARLERLTRFAAARGLELVTELATRRPDPSGDPSETGLSGYAIDELAVSAGISRWAACRRVAEADAVTTRHPKLLAAIKAGVLAPYAASRVLEATVHLDLAQCAWVETRLLTRVGRPTLTDLGKLTAQEMAGLSTETVLAISTKATPAYLGRAARDLARRIDPDTDTNKRARAKTGRTVRMEPPVDGMAWLWIYGPEAQVLAAYQHIDGRAHALPDDQDGQPDERGIDAKRADVALDLLQGACINLINADGGVTPPSPVNLHITIDQRTTGDAGRGDGLGASCAGVVGEPEVAGLGPVTTDTIRDLLDLAHDTNGTVSEVRAVDQPCPGQTAHDANGPGPYAPPERLKHHLRVRNRTCVFPGCPRPSRHCELDHTLRHPDGPTCACNLAPLCVHHHHLKHQAPNWQLANHGDGTLTWTTPTNRTITVGPDHDPRPPPNPVEATQSDQDPPF